MRWNRKRDAYRKDLSDQLGDLLVRLGDRLPAKDQLWVSEFLLVGELGLALEQMADALSEDEQPLFPDERAALLALAERMQLGDRASSALELCPVRPPVDP